MANRYDFLSDYNIFGHYCRSKTSCNDIEDLLNFIVYYLAKMESFNVKDINFSIKINNVD